MPVRGIRGAVVSQGDQAGLILKATKELLQAIMGANPELVPEDIASVIFTTTEDISAAYPAKAARQLGWLNVPLLCAREIPVPGSLSCCIRILVHWNTELPQSEIRHIYLGEAISLRPDL